jgi:hypothetical protein
VAAAHPRRNDSRLADHAFDESGAGGRPLGWRLCGIVLGRERLMGIGQAITMPLFFASNASTVLAGAAIAGIAAASALLDRLAR